MTERIDLDELATESDDSTEQDSPNRGDWFWRGEGTPDDEPDEASTWATYEETEDDDHEESADADRPDAADQSLDEGGSIEQNRKPVPRVPRSDDGMPVGIPVDQGGAGGAAAANRPEQSADAGGDDGAAGPERRSAGHESEAGGDADGMTMAITFDAVRRLANPQRAFAEASNWTDWVGIVGDVSSPVIQKFQRDHRVDVDFFNGSGSGPGERLADIGEHSMFYADRMVVVGIEGRDEHIAETADWEFVPFSEAAAKAGWKVKNS